ncbi:hypothetical protein Tco_1444477, partial [Tanacetum coccineum]
SCVLATWFVYGKWVLTTKRRGSGSGTMEKRGSVDDDPGMVYDGLFSDLATHNMANPLGKEGVLPGKKSSPTGVNLGRSSYVRAMVELKADVELIDTIVVVSGLKDFLMILELLLIRVNAAITKLQLLKRLRLLEDFLLSEKG